MLATIYISLLFLYSALFYMLPKKDVYRFCLVLKVN